MGNKKKISMMLVVIILLQFILPVLTVIWESGFTVKSMAAETLEATVDGITWTYEVQDGNATNVKPKDKSILPKEVIIPSKLNGYLVISIGEKAFAECSSLTSITVEEGNLYYVSEDGVLFDRNKTQIICYPPKKEGNTYKIPDTVISIDKGAFYECSSLTSIEIPGSVTSIGSDAFNKCSSLTSVEIPASVTSIGEYVFSLCSSLRSITVEEGSLYYVNENGVLFNKDKTEIICYPAKKEGAEYKIPDTVTSIESAAFLGCNSLTSITIPNNVTGIGRSAFYKCGSLKSIEIPKSVTSIADYAFAECSSLTSIEIPEGITSIGGSIFYNCSSLKNIEIPKSVTSIGEYAFRGCSSLTSITIPNNVTGIGRSAFYGCSSLKEIEIPTGVVSTGEYTFAYCSSLSTVEVPASLLSLGNSSFFECSNLTSINVKQGNPNYTSEDGILFNKNKTEIMNYPAKKVETTYKIPNTVTTIGVDAFYNCSELKSIEIPNSVTEIHGSAFHGCSSLTNIKIPAGVTYIASWAFEECSSLTSITVEEGNLYYVSEDGVLFNKNKTEILRYPEKKEGTRYKIPNTVTRICGSAFYGCRNLTNIDIPNTVTRIGSKAFSRCSNLQSIQLPNTVTKIGFSAFDGCSGLTSIEIPNGVTQIENTTFKECNFTSIIIPETVTSIGNSVFEGCNNLTNIIVKDGNQNYISENGVLLDKKKTKIICYPAKKEGTIYVIPNGVESVESYAFNGCINLKRILIPNSVTSIGDFAFYGCKDLVEIEVEKGNSKYLSEEGVLFNKNKTEIICYPIQKEEITYVIPNTVKTIADAAFVGSSNLTKISMPNGLINIGNMAFAQCEKMISTAIPSSVSNIGSTIFFGCRGLTIYYKKNSEAERYAENNKSNYLTYIVDDTLPLITSIEGNIENWTKESVTLKVNAKDDLSGLAEEAYSFDGGKSWQVENIKEYTENTNGIVIKVRDILGNEITYGEKININKIDKEAPIITSIEGNPENWIKESVTLKVNAKDGLSGLAEKAYSFDGGKSWQAENTKEYTENINGIVIKVRDVLGNETTYGETIDITKIKKVIGIEITEAPYDTEYVEGQIFNPEGMVVTAIYNDETTSEVENYEINPNGKLTIADRKVTISYEEDGVTKEADQEITVIEKQVIGIEITEAPYDTEYVEGQIFNPEGMVVTAIYNDETTSEVENYEINPNGKLTIEDTKVTISYTEEGITQTADQEITVIEKKLTGIIIKRVPHKTTYTEGQNFDANGMKVIATYNDDTSKEIFNYVVMDGGNLTAGQAGVTIRYTEDGVAKITVQRINVSKKSITAIITSKKELTRIKVTTKPNNLEYIEGQTFNPEGMKVRATYSDGTTQEITDYIVTDGENLTLGKTSVTISYTEKEVTQTTTQEITVSKKALTGIEITQAQNKTEYVEGQTFNPEGMKVTAIYNDGTSEEISNYVVTDEENLTAGKTNVMISYTENEVTKTIAQEITVEEKSLSGIEVTAEPNNVEYIEGQTFNPEGMKVRATYNDGTSKEITDYIVKDGENLAAGKTNVMISYTENEVTKTIAQEITVEEKLQLQVEGCNVSEEKNDKYIENILPNTTINNMISKIDTNGEIKIFKGTEEITDQNEKIATGMTIKTRLNGQEIEYTAVVKGDLNGDGELGDVDLLRMARYKAGLDKNLQGVYLKAADINNNNEMADDIDLLKLARILVALDSI